tara:strand:+ start:218 stop:412 length:195 start_codon:yes stop_codon:yes gene_type:complete
VKVGDLVHIKKEGLSSRIAHKVGKKAGVIVTAKRYGPHLQLLVLVGGERFFFVAKYLEVISEGR